MKNPRNANIGIPAAMAGSMQTNATEAPNTANEPIEPRTPRGWRSSFTGFFRRISTSFTGQSAAETARLGLRGVRDKHAAACNYSGWCQRGDAGTARK